jgi:hypothetical protein
MSNDKRESRGREICAFPAVAGTANAAGLSRGSGVMLGQNKSPTGGQGFQRRSEYGVNRHELPEVWFLFATLLGRRTVCAG